MPDPHTCPRCEGERKVLNRRSGQMDDCPTCSGTGVVWDRGEPQESAVVDANDALDLTYRR